MKFKSIVGIALATLIFASCDDTTDELGSSLTNKVDHLEISTDTFKVTTRSIVADSVLSRNTIGYLGKIRDPETGTYVSGDFMVQFATLENYSFPEKDSIMSTLNGSIIADSCEIRLFYTNFYGDSLASMKLTAYEMGKVMSESTNYYSNFDPIAEGYIRNDGNELKVNKVYSLTDLNEEKETREDDDYTPNIRIKLTDEYTDAAGKTYHNYGTYIMNKYYENPTYFKNSYNFIHNVVPGFYFKNQSGLGSMAYVNISQLNVYFRYKSGDSIYVGRASFAGTEEVLQTNKITNDKSSITQLAADNTCTYLKTPAGIFTEVTLPIEDIVKGHENDTINTAKLILGRINNSTTSEYELPIPSRLLLIPADSIYSFFENNNVTNNRTSFLSTYSNNLYTFSNISSLISAMNKSDKTSENWNKVVLIPVTVTSSTSTSGVTTVTKIVHDMSLTSTKLIGGSDNPNSPITISVIYSKFK